MKYFAKVGDRGYECTLDEENRALYVEVEGRRHRVDLTHIPRSHVYSLLLDGRSYEFTVHAEAETIELSGGAGVFHVEVEDARTHAARAKTLSARRPSGPRAVNAIMPGIVREVLVETGAAVAKGDALLVLEAMKMQNEIRADHAGRVVALHVAAGDTVDKGARLLEIE